MAKKTIDLQIIKKLVSEMEIAIDNAEAIKEAKGDKLEWIVELSKASGLAATIVGEGALLMGDIQNVIQGGPAAPVANPGSILDKFLGGKGPGSAN